MRKIMGTRSTYFLNILRYFYFAFELLFLSQIEVQRDIPNSIFIGLVQTQKVRRNDKFRKEWSQH